MSKMNECVVNACASVHTTIIKIMIITQDWVMHAGICHESYIEVIICYQSLGDGSMVLVVLIAGCMHGSPIKEGCVNTYHFNVRSIESMSFLLEVSCEVLLVGNKVVV